jgi:D-xylose 1-dehydrogenase (NADP+, D-xylono-1,5-lactone-forming)
MVEKIKWGVLGYARIARNEVIPAIQRAVNSEFYAIASRDMEKLAECQSQFGCTKLYSSYEALLEDPEVRAVYIPLPNSLHKEWVIKAAQRGKHVLCEKPIGLNAGECLEMMTAANKNRVILMEAFMYRYIDRIQKVTAVLNSGELGAIKYINSSFRFFLNRSNTIKEKKELGGGSLYDVGCYPINFVGMVAGSTPVSVAGEVILANGVDTIFSGVIKYSNGIIATVNSGFNAFNRMYSEIIGTNGILEIPDTFAGNEGAITVITEAGSRQIPVRESDRYVLEVTDFADAILNQRKPLLCLEETMRNMRVIDQFGTTGFCRMEKH